MPNITQRKYIELKNVKGGSDDNLKIAYSFTLTKDILNIAVTSNKEISWFLGEQWCTEDIRDKLVTNQTSLSIEYNISKRIPQFKDDRLYCYPMVRNNYACFTGVIGLYLPMVQDDFVEFKVTFKTNFPMFVSGIGLIEKSKTLTTNIHHLKNQLFVFTKSFIDDELLTLTFKTDAFFFIDRKEIVESTSRFIKRCFDFFGLKIDVKFLVNYNGWIVQEDHKYESIGYGGNGNYAGFNFLVVEKQRTPELANKIKIYLFHELYHHFNRSSDYESNWFSEGFTEFFCRYLSLPRVEYIAECNRFLVEYWTNPYRNSKIDIMTRENFWNNRFIEKLPYSKGFVYAMYLLQKFSIKFIELYKTIIIAGYQNISLVINNDMLKSELGDTKFDDYIINGKTIEIITDRYIEVPSIKIGFNLDKAINAKVIESIDKDSDAYKQGVRDGPIDELNINTSQGTILIIQKGVKNTFNIVNGPLIKVPQIDKL